MKTNILIGINADGEIKLIASGIYGVVNDKYGKLIHANGGEFDELQLFSNPAKKKKFNPAKDLATCENTLEGAKNNLATTKKSLEGAKKALKNVKSSVSESAKELSELKKDKKASAGQIKLKENHHARVKADEKQATKTAKASVNACENMVKQRKEELKDAEGYLKALTDKDK